MSDKFTYIDFLMYIIPGAFLSSVLLLLLCLIIPETLRFIKADLFSSIVFIIFSFILGNCVQVHSHLGPETRLKKEYWKGYYPSQIMFFPDNPVINEQGRSDLIKACQLAGLISEKDIQLFSSNNEYPKTGINKGQNTFNYMRVYLADKKEGERIRASEGYFFFFRGIFVASYWAAMGFITVALLYLLRLKWPTLSIYSGDLPSLLSGFFLPLFGAIICLYFWRTFRYRCRGAAQGFPREVYRAFCAHFLIEKQNTH